MTDDICPTCGQPNPDPEQVRLHFLRSALLDAWRNRPYSGPLGDLLRKIDFLDMVDDTIRAVRRANAEFSEMEARRG